LRESSTCFDEEGGEKERRENDKDRLNCCESR
jgi:hypothetical protein